MKKRLLIAGGGPSGLLAAHVFRRCGLRVAVLEPSKIGGEFLSGGLKYIHHTSEMESLLNRLEIPFSPYKVSGGILLQGDVKPYPAHLWSIPKSDAERIRRDHYKKTRRTCAENIATAMNDPTKKGPRRALRCDFHELIAALAEGVEIIPQALESIGDGEAKLADGTVERYDYLITTIPLWALRPMASFYVPETVAARLNIAIVNPRLDKYVQWDYVYTPYTPANVVHRFSPNGSGYAVEANGNLDHIGLESDLNFIFPDGYAIEIVREGLKGHLLPLSAKVEWPENVAPIGRFAKWDSRCTMDVALEDVIQLAERWLG